jgi:hypothetical protein
VSWEKLSPIETGALETLRTAAVKKGWQEESFPDLATSPFMLNAPIAKVQKILAKALKPGRDTLSTVRIAGGKIEEITEATFTEIEERARQSDAVAATVSAPTRGCPAPDFERAEIRATRVLEAFLDDGQRDDFRQHNRFVSVGVDTGCHYMVTSRHARDSLARYQRSLYDLDSRMPVCVHDWSVPAAEEMLALHLHLAVPGGEAYLRRLPPE